MQNLQHADGSTALENGSVDAWAGLDPIMAAAEARTARSCSTATSTSTPTASSTPPRTSSSDSPDLAQAVVDAYEKARAWAAENPDETRADPGRGRRASTPSCAKTVMLERTNLDVDPAPGAKQAEVLEVVGPIFVETGDVSEQAQVDDALDTLFDTDVRRRRRPGRVGG